MIILQHLIQTDQFKTTLILLDEYIVVVEEPGDDGGKYVVDIHFCVSWIGRYKLMWYGWGCYGKWVS